MNSCMAFENKPHSPIYVLCFSLVFFLSLVNVGFLAIFVGRLLMIMGFFLFRIFESMTNKDHEKCKNVSRIHEANLDSSSAWVSHIFTSSSGLAKSMKQMYQQPLHYLTNIRVKEWDQMRSDAAIKAEPLGTIIHPCKAETKIWLMEEVHRLTSSYQFLAKLWLPDPM